MRRLLIAVPALALAATLAGCGGSSSDSSSDRPVPAPQAPHHTRQPGGSGGSGSSRSDGDDATCREVRAGIDAFNTGDYDATVRHFKRAIPLAKSALESGESQAAEDLLDAVRYYAALAPEDYLTASATSPDFAKYKAITLGQCESGGSGGGDGGSGGDDGGVAI